MRESEIERYFVRRVREMGGWAYKFVSPGNTGIPDRLVCWPGGFLNFVELKAPGEVSKPHQLREHERLRNFGFSVSVLDSKQAIDEWLERI